jgi:hypothetical protein
LADLQLVGVLVTAASVSVAAIYYILTLRINMKTQELALKAQQQTLETRQFQMLMQLADIHRTPETFKNYLEFMKMEWSDYDDFEKKYDSDVNPNNSAIRDFVATWFKKAGIMLRYGMIDKELMYDFLGEDAIQCWNKYGEIVRAYRKRYASPDYVLDWDYLYGEMVKVAESRGHETNSTMHVKSTV